MKTLVCHGDSLTSPDELDRRSIWPSLVESRLKINVINSGIGGDTSGGLLSRFYPGVVQHEPDVVLIMCGTNDLWWDLEIKMIVANIFSMTCQAEHHDIVPLVGLPLPIIVEKACEQEFAAPAGGYDNCTEKLASLAKTLARAAKQNDIVCLDFYHPFCDKSGSAMGKYFLDDGLHPNKDGNRQMAEITIKILRGRFNFT